MAVTKTTTYDGEYTVDKFTGDGTTTWVVPAGVTQVEYLVVGGGGGASGAGGGAGGLLAGTGLSVSNHLDITVGTGGIGGAGYITNGGNSILKVNDGAVEGTNLFTAIGGGKGHYVGVSGDGGSGGGEGYAVSTHGHGTVGQGYDGATGGNNQLAMGGGGASEAGQVQDGGDGVQSDIVKTGVNVYYAGGGGGGGLVTHGHGGLGGGGDGAPATATAGTNGLGGGGGGDYNTGTGAGGGSGIVIIRYLTPSVDNFSGVGMGSANMMSTGV
jgi:hypothetical protein